MNYLKELFSAPAFEDEIKTQQAYMLHVILWTLICVPIPYLAFIFVKGTDDPNRVLAQAAFGEITNIILLILLRRVKCKPCSTTCSNSRALAES